MQRLEKHQTDYKPKAYENYSVKELGDFVHLLSKRATHRSNKDKATKDIYDAKNYLTMITLKLKSIASGLDIDFDTL